MGMWSSLRCLLELSLRGKTAISHEDSSSVDIHAVELGIGAIRAGRDEMERRPSLLVRCPAPSPNKTRSAADAPAHEASTSSSLENTSSSAIERATMTREDGHETLDDRFTIRKSWCR